MKTLLLLRHAKADRKHPNEEDFDRPLAAEGRADAARLGDHLKAEGLAPALVLCSAARRAQETWSCVAERLASQAPLLAEEALYSAPPAAILRVVHPAPTAASPLLVIAHNPGMESLARALAGPDSDPEAVQNLQRGYPSSGLAVIDFDIESWAEADVGEGRLRAFVTPRDLDAT